jgi:DNA replication licensing factor MCM4
MDDLKNYIMYAKSQFKPQLMDKEAMKQSVVDPKTGRIDVTILTTGYSAEDRRHRDEIDDTLKKLIREKGELNA